ncbi:hypothetical protein FE783_36575 [Paenibacillus mesophilus]|uniref:hypothetical protein n=1 Tax=Paenibacillus mesophilus TaxID=2582849 RepID=UPI00110E3FE1|nr:hypothetical protein [Paenibacillus mesophilus]TMV43029.1 hypothetical protein FE783_36575 [Paenibacillus mesophilus]
MRNNTKPILSLIGFGLFIVTLVIHLCFRFVRTSDVGVDMLLSLADALLLVITLLWSVMGIIELRILLKSHGGIKDKLDNGRINKDEYKNISRRHKFCFTINISYLVIILFQLGYVIFNWYEVNV